MVWEYSGTIQDNFYESEWVIVAYDLLTSDKVAEVTTTSNTFTIPLPSPNPVSIVVFPRRFDIWNGSVNIGINDRVYPTDPVSTPYYYRCITAGTTGTSEPNWAITPSATVTDGSVVWVIVERIIRPTVHSPIMPVVT